MMVSVTRFVLLLCILLVPVLDANAREHRSDTGFLPGPLPHRWNREHTSVGPYRVEPTQKQCTCRCPCACPRRWKHK